MLWSVGLFCVVNALCLVHGRHSDKSHESLDIDTREEITRILAGQNNDNNRMLQDEFDRGVSNQWSELLENITVSGPPFSARTAKATYGMAGVPMNQFNPYRRVGEAPPLRNDGQNNYQFRQAPMQFGNRLISPSEVSETDLYLLSAIEKLVYRVDYLEKRLHKTDKLVLHLLNQVNTQQSTTQTLNQQQLVPSTTTTTKPTANVPISTISSVTTAPPPAKSECPKDFTRIASTCYHIEVQTPTDWQTANLRCKSHGGRLAEFEKSSTLKQVKTHLINVMGKDKIQLWLGGLNPGLLWIWSSSAKPVDTFNATAQDATSIQEIKKNMDIAGNGRCLNLMSNGAKKVALKYYGEDCSKNHSYLCEMHDRTVENTITRVLRALRLD